MKSKRYWIETYGCEMNKAESNALELTLKNRDWESAATAGNADLIIINSCVVRKTAEDRIRGRIGFFRAIKKKKSLKIALMGCMAQAVKESLLAEEKDIDILLGTLEKDRFKKLIDSVENDLCFPLSEDDKYEFSSYHRKESEYKAFVPIMHGCNNFCSYCIVPHVRGRETSRSPESILNEIEALLESGVKEITLLGQNVNSYCYNEQGEEMSFSVLLDTITRHFPSGYWLRFLSSHPKDFSPQLTGLIADRDVLCNHIHLPVQHGSDRILQAMNRNYTRKHYLHIVNTIKKTIPDASLSTDILIGFPGEKEVDFEDTMDLVEKMRFHDAFTYYYNPREGTAAYSMSNEVPEAVKLERLEHIIQLQRKISDERRMERIEKTVPVLIEGVSKYNDKELLGRTERDEMVVFPADKSKIGSFLSVDLISLRGNTFRGKEA